MDYVASLQLWGVLASLAFMIGLVITAIAYMLGSFLSDDRLKAWAKTEVLQIVFSAVIFAMAIFFVVLVDGVTQSAGMADPGLAFICANNPGRPCHFSIAINYIDTVFDAAKRNAEKVLVLYSYFSFVSSISVTWQAMNVEGITSSYPPLAGLALPADALSNAFDILVKGMVALKFQEFLLDFIHQLFFPIFLTMGVIARSFAYTRKFGGLMIALALSMNFIFPGTYILLSMALSQTTAGTLYVMDFDGSKLLLPSSEDAQYGARGPDYYDSLLDEYGVPKNVQSPEKIDICESAQDQPTKANVLTFLTGFWTRIKNIFTKEIPFVAESVFSSGWLLKSDYSDPLHPHPCLFDEVSKIILFSAVLPFIAIITTISAAKTMSPLFGGDVEIAGLTHLI